MTRMLASAASLQEVEIALSGGADIIELRDPARGTLGAVSLDTIRAAMRLVGRRRLVSAVCGDRPMQPDLIAESVRDIAATGVDYIKIGMAPGGEACIDAFEPLASQVNLIAVFFADAAPDLSLLPLLKRRGFAGAMLDTRDKTTGPLLDHFDIARLRRFVDDCRAEGLVTGLAGGLETPDIPRLLVMAPDLLGFRGALCSSGGLDLGHMRAVRELIPQEAPEPAARDVDYRLLTARGYRPAVVPEDVPVDLVFVDDLVLPVFIGAYARERDAPQNVRFGVTASVMRTGRAAEDIRDVFSYDLITDGIRMLIGSGHVQLVETLAERIAAMVLNHPRVVKVVVRVQKLDTGSGTVGVEIERTRMTARAADRPVMPLAEASGQS